MMYAQRLIRTALSICFLTMFFVSKVLSEAVIIEDNTDAQVLGPHMSFIVDTAGELSFDEVRQKQDWTQVDGPNIIGGFTESVYWVKFTVQNKDDVKHDWILEVDYPIIDFIEFYEPSSGGSYNMQVAGDQYPFDQRPIDYRNIVFPVSSPANEAQTFYMRFQTESSMYIALNMLPNNTFTEIMDGKLIIYGFIYGIVFLATIYCLINAVFLRERMYFLIAIGIFCSLGYSTSINGFAFQYLWPNNLWMQSVSIPFFLNICFGFALFYSREFLDLKNISTLIDKIIIFLSSFCLLVAAASLVLSYASVIRISTVFAIVMSVAAFVAGAISYYKGNKSARYYLIGWMALFIGAVTFALKSLGLIPSNNFAIWAQELGFACIAIFLTLAQSDRFFQARKKHEAEQAFSLNAVKSAEKKYRSLFENALEGIFQVDLSGRLLNANQAFAQIVGSEDIDLLLAQPHAPFSLACLSDSEQKKFKAVLDRDDALSGFETSIKLPSKETRWISISIQKINNKHGMAMHYEGTIADITETKKRQQAEKQQRMAEASTEAKSLFLANMSHEIRTPMNAIIGFTDLALDRNKDLQLSNYLQKIRMASSNLLGIINDILDFSKIEAGKLEIEEIPFSLKEVLNNLTNIVSVNVEAKGLALNIVVDEDIPDQLVGDPLRIGQVLLNLTNNAVKFTTEGSITVEIELLSLNKRDMSINLTGRIIDTGIGIPEDKLKTLFSSFTQADDSTTRRFGGTGLGLSISKQLVEMMGGEVSVESTPGEGSTFSFTLCCNLQDRRHRTNPHFIYHQLPLNVLVVDDQRVSRELIEKVLLSLGHHVTCVSNAEETIQELTAKQEQGLPYDMLMADWLMPDIDGIQCCQMIKDDPKIINPRMVLITGYDQDDAKQKVKEAGIDAYMLKPLKISELAQVIEEIFKDRRDNQINNAPVPSNFQFQNLNLLLVEDVKMNQELAIEILSKKHIHTSIANNGQEAVDMVGQETFDVVLMDMQMPVLDGCQATEMIRKFNQRLPIIAMTANAMTGDKNKCLASGMNDYITKPIDPEEMFDAISKWVSLSTSGAHHVNAITQSSEVDKLITQDLPQNSASNLNDASLKFIASLEQDMGEAASANEIKHKPENSAQAIEDPEYNSTESLQDYLQEMTQAEPDNKDADTNSAPPQDNEDLTQRSAERPSLNINQGLARCQQNTRLYLKFLADFIRNYEDSATLFQAYLASSDLDAIEALAHKIKGVSSNLAAEPLAELSGKLEHSKQFNADAIKQILTAYATELENCLTSMKEVLEQSAGEEDEATNSEAELFDVTVLAEKLNHLDELIQAQELDAQDIAMNYLSSWPVKDHEGLLREIIDALDLFDFTSANEALNTLRTRLNSND